MPAKPRKTATATAPEATAAPGLGGPPAPRRRKAAASPAEPTPCGGAGSPTRRNGCATTGRVTPPRAALAARLAEDGTRVVDPPRYGSSTQRLDRLGTTVEEHAGCPGHAAYIDLVWIGDDEDLDEDDDDGRDGDLDEDGDAAGRCEAVAVHVCTDPKTHHGHGVGAPPDPAGDARRAEAAAERREVVESNKAWASAETVRRGWLRQFVARKSAPAGAAAFVAGSLAWCDHALRDAAQAGNPLAHELLGLGEAPGHGRRGVAVAAALGKATEARAQVVALALVLAAYETAATREHWRAVDPGTARYLRWIEGHGYELAPVELRACGAKPAKAKTG